MSCKAMPIQGIWLVLYLLLIILGGFCGFWIDSYGLLQVAYAYLLVCVLDTWFVRLGMLAN